MLLLALCVAVVVRWRNSARAVMASPHADKSDPVSSSWNPDTYFRGVETKGDSYDSAIGVYAENGRLQPVMYESIDI